jgi:hypothetical protein
VKLLKKTLAILTLVAIFGLSLWALWPVYVVVVGMIVTFLLVQWAVNTLGGVL